MMERYDYAIHSMIIIKIRNKKNYENSLFHHETFSQPQMSNK